MDHLPSHPTHDTDPYSDSLTNDYDEIGSWSFMNTASKDFDLTFTSFGGMNIPREATFLPDPLGLSSTLRVGVPPYESSYVLCCCLPSRPSYFPRAVRLENVRPQNPAALARLTQLCCHLSPLLHGQPLGRALQTSMNFQPWFIIVARIEIPQGHHEVIPLCALPPSPQVYQLWKPC